MGKLHAVVVNGTDLSGDRLGKCDAYVVLLVGGQRSQTTVKRNNKNPVWNEAFAFDANPTDTLIVEVWDKDVLTKDDQLGREEIVVGALGLPGPDGTVQRSVALKKGRVNLALRFDGPPASPARPDVGAATVVARPPITPAAPEFTTVVAPSPAKPDYPLPPSVSGSSITVVQNESVTHHAESTITSLLSRMELPPLRGNSIAPTVPLTLLRAPAEASPPHPTNVRVEVWWIQPHASSTLWIQGDIAPLDAPRPLAAPEEHAAPWVGNFELPSESLVRWQVGVRDERGNFEWSKPRVHLTSTTNSQTSHVLWGKGSRA